MKEETKNSENKLKVSLFSELACANNQKKKQDTILFCFSITFWVIVIFYLSSGQINVFFLTSLLFLQLLSFYGVGRRYFDTLKIVKIIDDFEKGKLHEIVALNKIKSLKKAKKNLISLSEDYLQKLNSDRLEAGRVKNQKKLGVI